MEKVMRLYYVWPKFPSISITGSACALNCKHCDKVYLKHMTAATTPDKLLKLCKTLKIKGAQHNPLVLIRIGSRLYHISFPVRP